MALGEANWSEILLGLRMLTDSDSALVLDGLHDQPGSSLVTDGVCTGLLQAYGSDFGIYDRLGHYAAEVPGFEGGASNLFAEQPDLHDPDFESALNRYGVAERWGLLLDETTAISLHRRPGRAVYSITELGLLKEMGNHLRTAYSSYKEHLKLRRSQDEVLERFSGFGVGVVLLDDRGVVEHQVIYGGAADRQPRAGDLDLGALVRAFCDPEDDPTSLTRRGRRLKGRRQPEFGVLWALARHGVSGLVSSRGEGGSPCASLEAGPCRLCPTGARDARGGRSRGTRRSSPQRGRRRSTRTRRAGEGRGARGRR